MDRNYFMNKFNQLKQEIHAFLSKNPLDDLKGSVNDIFVDARNDLKDFVDKDIPKLKKKFDKERKQIETMLDQKFKLEIKAARKFVTDAKKEMKHIQRMIDDAMKKHHPTKKKSASKKKVTKKKATNHKKSSKKVVSRKKSTKKMTSKRPVTRKKK